MSWQGGKWWEDTYENGHFNEGMSDGWNMALFGKDGFFAELMGGAGNDLLRRTMAPLYDFVDRHAKRPLFLWFAPQLPHTPFDAPYTYAKLYRHKPLSESAKLYYANISWWDHGLGQVMDFFESRGLLDDTLFVYVGDNGWEQDAQVEYKRPNSNVRTDALYANGGLKGKSGLYDLSFRTPMIFHWPGRVRQGFNATSLVSSLDLLPTLLDIVGLPTPPDLPGRSLAPLLLEARDATEYVERQELVGYVDTRRAARDPMGQPAEGFYVRTPRWHFLRYRDSGERALYDMSVDPRSGRDVAAQHPELVARFTRRIEDWAASMGVTPGLRVHE